MSRLILVVFWVMLQTIAPLTHAHSNQNWASTGLHIPGLEHYNADKQVGYSAPTIEDNSGALITVNSGLKHTRTELKVDSVQASVYALPDDTLLPTRAMCFVEIDFSTQASPIIFTFPANHQRTRAPPAKQTIL